MSKKIVYPTSDEVRTFFFEAMATGYAVGANYRSIRSLSGWKANRFEQGDLVLVDAYCTTPGSEQSTGITTISYKGKSVWVMHYGGAYEQQAIKLLKGALKYNYTRGVFIGGRGPYIYKIGDLAYYNEPAGSGQDFKVFYGEERIDNEATKTCMGTHWYRGRWLVND